MPKVDIHPRKFEIIFEKLHLFSGEFNGFYDHLKNEFEQYYLGTTIT